MEQVFGEVYLSRQTAQEQAAKARGSLEDRTNCKIHAHENHYIGKKSRRNLFFQKK
jgi:ssRNA-specific RNase YbeY (16S rRNA maturation enzyme)